MSVKFSIPDSISGLSHSHYLQRHLLVSLDISSVKFVSYACILSQPPRDEPEYVARPVLEKETYAVRTLSTN